MEIRGQELEAAATVGVDATRPDVIRRGAGNQRLIRDIPRRPGRGLHED